MMMMMMMLHYSCVNYILPSIVVGIIGWAIWFHMTREDEWMTDQSSLSSSVWCHTLIDQNENMLCTFNNLCYLPKTRDFAFFLAERSVVSGLRSKQDLQTLSLSSVANHNGLLIKLNMIPDEQGHETLLENVTFVQDPIYLIARFKCDNVHHVIHDDLLPIFATYNHICAGDVGKCSRTVTLTFSDNCQSESHIKWFEIFSSKPPLVLNSVDHPICFRTVHTGVSRETLWYQYGFKMPHGPIVTSPLTGSLIDKFTDYILSGFHMERSHRENGVVTLFSRKINRKIVNENYVREEIRKAYKELGTKAAQQVHTVDCSTNSTAEILSVVLKSELVVGVHGSSMVYALFLPVGSAVVELFPYGILPQHVSPVRMLHSLPGIRSKRWYLSWMNFKEENSVAPSGKEPLLGSISHLPLHQQERIRSLKSVPAVECCHDPAYLYRMFQDTVVDDSFRPVVRQALAKLDIPFPGDKENHLRWYFPSAVLNVTCRLFMLSQQIVTLAAVSWERPINARLNAPLTYHVTVQVRGKVMSLKTSSTTAYFSIDKGEGDSERTAASVWVTASIDENYGLDSHNYCYTS